MSRMTMTILVMADAVALQNEIYLESLIHFVTA